MFLGAFSMLLGHKSIPKADMATIDFHINDASALTRMVKKE